MLDFFGFYIPNMGVRLIPLRNGDELVSVSRELGKRAWGYVLYDGPRRVLLASQSGLYNAVNGTIQKRYHKTWRIERVALQDLPQRFTELQAEGYRRNGWSAIIPVLMLWAVKKSELSGELLDSFGRQPAPPVALGGR